MIEPGLHHSSEQTRDVPPVEFNFDCRILVADDRREIRMLSKYFLTKAGAKIVEAEEGEQALQIVEAERERNSTFDLILLDMQMPRLDGYSAATRLREMGFAGPIIALTADAMQGYMKRCLESGCDDYLSKPIDRQKLLEKVEYYLSRYGMNRMN